MGSATATTGCGPSGWGGKPDGSAAERDRLPTAQAPSGCVHLAAASDPKAALALIAMPISAE